MSDKRKRLVKFAFDDLSLATPQEMAELEKQGGKYITMVNPDNPNNTRQILIPNLTYICTHCKKVH